MAWTAPMTFVASTPLTAAQLNTHLRDNLLYLKSSGTAFTAAAETTASTTFTDLATVGPSVTVVTDVQAIVLIHAQLANDTTNGFATMGFAVSGATTIAATAPSSIGFQAYTANAQDRRAGAFLVALTPGSNTFTAKYQRELAGTITATNRRITVIPG